MAYQFHGFFIDKVQGNQSHISSDTNVIRNIDAPFSGLGVRLSQPPARDLATILELAAKMTLPRDCVWIYLDYACWGGLVESVWGYVHGTETSYGPLYDCSYTATESFQELMQAFGVLPKQALDFTPFRRGFWGEPTLLSETVSYADFCWVRG